MAADAVKAYVRSVFDNISRASPEAQQLVKEFLAHAFTFHRDVVAPAKTIGSYGAKLAWLRRPEIVQAENDLKAYMVQLKAHGINLLGYSPADICDALVELYGQRPRRP